MESKEKLIKDLQFYVFNFNEYWEDPITESELVKNTRETCEEIISCCSLLNTKIKKQMNKNYEDYPKLVQDTIQNIISLVSDGRDLWHKVEYKNIEPQLLSRNPTPREYDHHIQGNGHLDFENNPLIRLNQISDTAKKIIEVIESAEATKDFDKFVGKILYWENYESGSAAIRLDQLNKDSKGKFTFDGLLVTFETVNGHCDADGVLISEVENYPLEKIPYCYQEWDDDEEVMESLEAAEEYTWERLKSSVVNSIENLIDSFK